VGEAMWSAIAVGAALAILGAAMMYLLYVVAAQIVRAFPGTKWRGSKTRTGRKWHRNLFALAFGLWPVTCSAMTPVEAIRAAAADLENLPPEVREHQRYLWLPQPSDEKRRAILFDANTVFAHSPVSVGEGRGVWIFAAGELIRFDLAVLAGQRADYDRLVAVWEDLARRDPYFHILETSGQLPTKGAIEAQASITKPAIVEAQVQAPPETAQIPAAGPPRPGQVRPDSNLGAAMRRAGATVPTATAQPAEPAPLPEPPPQPAPDPAPKHQEAIEALYLPADAWSALRNGTHSAAPIVRGDWLHELGTSSADDGVYPKFRGMQDLAGKKLKLQDYLLSRGIDLRLTQRLRADERAAIIRSGITGKPRRMRFVQGSGVRTSAGTGLCSITDDPFDADVLNPDFDPIRNLLVFKSRGSEVILELPSGWHEFSLWDADGNLVAEAPPQLAADHTIPSPHTTRLQYPISCVRCHAQEDGWRRFESDVPKLIARGGDIFDEFLRHTPHHERNEAEVLARLAGLYSGKLEEPLQLARNTYQDVVLRITGVGVIEASAAVAKVYADYAWQMVTPEIAAAELGVKDFSAVPKQEPEDSTLLLLHLGLAVNRKQWEFSYVEAATRLANAPPPAEPADNNAEPAEEPAADGDVDWAEEEPVQEAEGQNDG